MHLKFLFTLTTHRFRMEENSIINKILCYYKTVLNLASDMYTIRRHVVCSVGVGVGVVPVERNHEISAHIKCSYDFKEVSHFAVLLCATIISIVFHMNFVIDCNSC